jgi:hypothetical protein
MQLWGKDALICLHSTVISDQKFSEEEDSLKE